MSKFKVLTFTALQVNLMSGLGFSLLDSSSDEELVTFWSMPEGWNLTFNECHRFGEVFDPDGVLTVRLLSQIYRDNNDVMVFKSMMVLPRNHLEHKEGKGWFREQ
jgi:hypothetical protein